MSIKNLTDFYLAKIELEERTMPHLNEAEGQELIDAINAPPDAIIQRRIKGMSEPESVTSKRENTTFGNVTSHHYRIKPAPKQRPMTTKEIEAYAIYLGWVRSKETKSLHPLGVINALCVSIQGIEIRRIELAERYTYPDGSPLTVEE